MHSLFAAAFVGVLGFTGAASAGDVGACCAPDGGCTTTTEGGCAAGVFQGVATTCSPNPCPQPHTLTVTLGGDGKGSVVSSPPGIACSSVGGGGPCASDFNHATMVTLTATPGTGMVFLGWQNGPCSGTGACVVTMGQAHSVIAAFGMAPATEAYAVVRVGPARGSGIVYGIGIDNAGRVAGNRNTPDSLYNTTFIWENGAFLPGVPLPYTPAPPSAGPSGISVNSMSRGGAIAGGYNIVTGPPYVRYFGGYIYQNGVFTDLSALPPSTYYVDVINAVNDNGQCAATWTMFPAYTYWTGVYSGGVWALFGAASGPSNLLSGGAVPAAINSHGTVVGYGSVQGTLYTHAYKHEGGVTSDLGSLPNLGGFNGGTYAWGINDAGHIVGKSWTTVGQPTGASRAFLYQDGVMTDLGVIANSSNSQSDAKDINNCAQVVGRSNIPVGANGLGEAGMIWDSVRGMRNLQELAPAFDGWYTFAQALRITDRGEVLVRGYGGDSQRTTAMVLSPMLLWTGPSDGDWGDPANWADAIGPTTSTNVGVVTASAATISAPGAGGTFRSVTVGCRDAAQVTRLELPSSAVFTSPTPWQVMSGGSILGPAQITADVDLSGEAGSGPLGTLTIVGDVDLNKGTLGTSPGDVSVSGKVTGQGLMAGAVLAAGGATPSNPLMLTAPLAIGTRTLRTFSSGTVSLGPSVSIAGGLLTSATPMLLPANASLVGSGEVSGMLTISTDAQVTATGDLALGDLAISGAITSYGRVRCESGTLTLRSADGVFMGDTQVTLTGGNLAAPNGMGGLSITGHGTVSGVSVGAWFASAGAPGQTLTINGNVSADQIDASGGTVVINGDLSAGNLLASGGTIIINGNLTCGHVDATAGPIVVHGNLTTNGRVFTLGGVVQIDGDLVMLSGDTPAFVSNNGGSITVGGSIRGAGILAGPITSGPVIAVAPLNVIFYDVTLGTPPARLLSLGPARFRSTLTLDGTLDAPNGLIMDCVLRGCPCLRCGQLSGNGVINGDVSSEQGTITPGLSPGLITINGDFTNGGALNMEIAGPLPAQYDRLQISGTANLGGTLNVGFIDDYTPAAASPLTFALLTFSASTGEFAALNLPGLPEGLEWNTQALQSTGGVTVRPSCRADINASGTLTVQDIFDFLRDYFSDDPRGDFNQSGAISVQDIFDFLAAYFTGCSA